eukprot:scaffold1054_cov124-Cylindrotheca_fusiformis.AAC.1
MEASNNAWGHHRTQHSQEWNQTFNCENLTQDQNKNTTTTTATASTGFQMPHPSSIVALDCEMVGTGRYGERSSVARVTLIDWEGKALLDTYVSQTQKVTDYRTFVSGITKEQLEGATMTLEQCRGLVSRLLYNRILVGHGLKNDLLSLGISHHPWWLTRDTATYLPFMKRRANKNLACWWPRKLKELASEQLEREIQVYGMPHSPLEDALAALDLYKTVQSDWETEIYENLVKTNKLQQQRIAEERMVLMQQRQNLMYNNNNNNHHYKNYNHHHHHHNYNNHNHRYHNDSKQQRYHVPRQEVVLVVKKESFTTVTEIRNASKRDYPTIHYSKGKG